MNRSSTRAFYSVILLLSSVIALGLASTDPAGNDVASYVYDVRIETDRDTLRLGENITATVYLVNPGDREVLLEPIHQCTFSGNSVNDPNPVSASVNIDYAAGAKIRIGAHGETVFLRQTFTPEHTGPFRITCLGVVKTVNVTDTG